MYKDIVGFALSVSSGNLEASYTQRGKNDQLSSALLQMQHSMNLGISEVQKILEIVLQKGDLSVRLNNLEKEGAWLELGNTVNKLLDLFAKPLNQINAIVGKLSEGDLTKQYELPASGDLDRLKNNLNNSIKSLNQLLKHTQVGANSINKSSLEMTSLSSELKLSIEEITNSINEMSRGASDQMQKIDEASNFITEMRGISDLMFDKGNNINNLAKDSTKQSEVGKDLVEDVGKSISIIASGANTTKEAMEILKTKSQRISSVLDVITGVSSQTNLLALNAAIEAAQAGEAGRGFAVVAEEIRKLAEDSKISAVEIERLVVEIKEDIEKASSSTINVIKQIEEGQKKSEQAANSFTDLIQATVRVLESSNEIQDASEVQLNKIDEIFTVIQNVVVIAEETAAGSEEIASASSQLASGMNTFNSKVESLSETSKLMRESTERFTL